ncbi:uncharacterized protein LOC122455705 [Dermochelys coriacea]|uniref:uncharacterized protein LOC122455705 n=1 Tax=Dermochelys coriacea TaxID=27794 RepID=UPI001CA9BA46|nr:uncharacterized protein LOC122455705 [Dermochelys coriacea]
MVDEEEEEENGGQVNGGSILLESQEIFLILEPWGLQDIMVANHDAGEGTSAGNVSFSMLSTPESRLLRIRMRRNRMQEDMFTKIMNASGTVDTELRAWRISLSEKLDTDMESRKASHKHECVAQDEMLWIMRDKSDMLRCLVELQEQKQKGRVLLHTLWQSQPALPDAESPSAKHSMRHGRKVHYPFHLIQGVGTRNRRCPFTDL